MSEVRITQTEYEAMRLEIVRLRDELREITVQHRRVMEEPCSADEKHCTCVPILRRRIEQLRARVAELESAIEQKDNYAWVQANKWNTLLADRDGLRRKLEHSEQSVAQWERRHAEMTRDLLLLAKKHKDREGGGR